MVKCKEVAQQFSEKDFDFSSMSQELNQDALQCMMQHIKNCKCHQDFIDLIDGNNQHCHCNPCPENGSLNDISNIQENYVVGF